MAEGGPVKVLFVRGGAGSVDVTSMLLPFVERAY